MKKHLYLVIEAVLHLLLLMVFIQFCFIMQNILVIVLALIGSVYYVGQIGLGASLIIDIIEGSKEKNVIFLGSLWEESLDFFWKIYYTNIYFDDDVLTKHYRVFADANVLDEKIQRGDKITIKYYQRSRIILQISRNDKISD